MEQVMSLDLPTLNTLAQSIYVTTKCAEVPNFIGLKSKEDELSALRLDIVKDIIQDKLTAQANAENAVAIKVKRQRLEAILAAKQDTILTEMSEAEIKAELAKLPE